MMGACISHPLALENWQDLCVFIDIYPKVGRRKEEARGSCALGVNFAFVNASSGLWGRE